MTYLERPVFDVMPNFDSVKHGQLDDHSFGSVGLGAFTPWKVTERVKRTGRYPFVLGSRVEIKAFMDFFRARGTRLEGFWMPLYLNDYGLIETEQSTRVTEEGEVRVTEEGDTRAVGGILAGETTLTIKRIGLADKIAYGSQFYYLALYSVKESKLECYEIESVNVDGNTELINLTSGIETSVRIRDTICCALIYCRLSEDELALDWISGSAATTAIGLVELPGEYPQALARITEEGEGRETEEGDTRTTEDGGYTNSNVSRPVYLYRLRRGETTWWLTNWPETVNTGNEWGAADIEHGEIGQDVEFSLDPINITIATDDEDHPLRALLDPNLSEVTDLEIFETDYSTLTVDLTAPIYKGRIGECQFIERGKIRVQVSSAFRIGEQEAPKIILQRTCNHRLFDSGCGLVDNDFQTNGNITALSSGATPYIEAAEFGATATAEGDVNWFALGKVMVGTETRFCVGQSGDRLYLNAPFSSAVDVGNQANAWPGCDKRAGTCDAKFGNITNHLAWPLIPNRNPQFEALQTPKPGGGKK
jgi:uncharacterized phage protein (TIGR02218 family)